MDGTYLGVQSLTSLELACKTNPMEVFHLLAPRHFANPWFVQVVSHGWVVISRILKFFVCMYRVVDSFPCCLFFGTPRLSSIRAGDQSLMCGSASIWERRWRAATRARGNCGQSFVHELWWLGSRLCW